NKNKVLLPLPKSISTGNTNVSYHTFPPFQFQIEIYSRFPHKLPRGSNAIYYYLPDDVSPVTSAADTASAPSRVPRAKKPNWCRKEESLYRRSLDRRQVNHHLTRIRHTLSIINIKMSYDMHR
ncbi:hypothetical protein CEXT_208131, partial [Caerostris extrusa]